jgi:cysteinyl-tRNA synthetase
LLLKGYKASAIRLALISVPYRHQLNFTFEGLTEATNAIERLRTFVDRLKKAALNEGTTEALQSAANKAEAEYMAALENDLNTAEARAPIFDLVRTTNSALDQGSVLSGDRTRVLAVLDRFDSVFAVIADHDAEPTKAAVAWAQAHGLAEKIAPNLLVAQGLTDEEIDALIAERNLARKQRNFKRSDEIRDELAAKGIVIEDAKDGVRWKRK